MIFCINMGSNESHLNVSLIVRGKVTKQGPETTTLEEKGELKQGIKPMSSTYQPGASPLDQTCLNTPTNKQIKYFRNLVNIGTFLKYFVVTAMCRC